MPNLDSLNIPAAIGPHLKSDEILKHWAYGTKHSVGLLVLIGLGAFLIFIFLFLGVFNLRFDPEENFLGFLPVAIIMGLVLIPAMSLARKDYVIAVTDKRLIIIRIKKGMFSNSVANSRQLDFTEYEFKNLPPIQISIGGLNSSIKVNDAGKPFSAKFPSLLKGNKEEVQAIAEILSQY